MRTLRSASTIPCDLVTTFENGVWGDITAAENVLRDLIEESLSEQLGPDWLEGSGLSAERLEQIAKALEDERRRRDGGEVNPRLIYYSNLPDVAKILRKNWTHFAACFGDWKTMNVYLARLIDFRNPEMHGRDLLPFEEHLVRGITGEIRNKVTIFKSARKGEREFFPRIEHASDSFGNVAVRGLIGYSAQTALTLHPGDHVEFILKVWDPEGLPWTWSVVTSGLRPPSKYQIVGDRIEWDVTEEDIAETQRIGVWLHSSRSYHRDAHSDDAVFFHYRVLPKQ